MPAELKLPSKTNVASVHCGNDFTMILSAEGFIWAFGNCEFGQLGIGSAQVAFTEPTPIKVTIPGKTIAKLFLGGFHTLALTSDGYAYSWGYGLFGQLGHGDDQNKSTPHKINHFVGENIVKMAAGAAHCLALTDKGLYSWGGGEHGRLGHGTLVNVSTPKKIEAFAKQKVVDFACGADHTIVITEKATTPK